MLKSKKIIVGVSGSIAAYKIAILTRLLVKEGAEVKIVVTEAAKEFITPLTLSTLSKNPVLSSFVKDETGQWNNHVDLGLWADIILIAPATAHTLAKCANGICDDLLTAVYLSAKCEVMFAPAMDLDMYIHPSTVSNLEKLKSYGNHIIKSGFGELASGLVGEGRMAEPEELLAILEKYFSANPVLKEKKVLITAGPTQEAIDPVRFISNHSTGKMGYAIADKLAKAGAKVTLVSGQVALKKPDSSINLVKVHSAEEMYQASQSNFEESDIIILAAAVADYTPAVVADKKIKKKEDTFSIELVKTTDIAKTLGQQKRENQLMVGFALETDNEVANAKTKIQSKNLDMIVLNSLQDSGAGFGHDTNKISIIKKDDTILAFDLKSKQDVAQDIVNAIIEAISKNNIDEK
ncbi:bifunctional phosphopantothenoylcysteine decarboxylase/phosphopantothenate--cysteine ligase CoaBC [Arcicella sp. DC2W]|uniref:Coenzyme A biosynthesis bifunctional protein CoaBC n=1 Tax=Arcicella gelida TaxID=2984195 RepID=A0ABU5S0C2_9BACT|nr:bifunctional phosphopantothenoylcysteine decarboxylase/phosphopantothenate--cysteine ligase CoaBC [Arcicella sp. DC2W]MEA5401859.1 bifunctional phosphopantothenoylcysteine decarboxylase/phosphopantothenate--cysteine ligase CoaBC [Arcicella sp. DC2W]